MSITTYRRLATVELPYPVGRYESARYSWVELTPQTGRKHQLRRHMKHIFHPTVGDTSHGDGKHNQLFRDKFICPRLLLAAISLSLTHPGSGEAMTINAGLNRALEAIIERFGWNDAVAPYQVTIGETHG
jgi:tRNA pseudouridine65 synthase